MPFILSSPIPKESKNLLLQWCDSMQIILKTEKLNSSLQHSETKVTASEEEEVLFQPSSSKMKFRSVPNP